MHSIICLYAKPPVPGRTKSRLAADIGSRAAADLARAMLLDLTEAVRAVPNARPTIWHPPDSNPEEFMSLGLPDGIWFYPQQGDDLGQRMWKTVELLLRHHPDSGVVIIGSDCITHSVETLVDAVDALVDHDVVIQPAADGGYVLVGQRTVQPAIFDGIEWGGDTVMASTRERLRKHRINYIEMPETFDVDMVDDLERLRGFLADNDRPRTAAWLAAFDRES
jgi:rSAM/selenodomain-associated transferase 1